MGGRVGVLKVPSLVKAPDLLMNSASAAMPSFVPRRTDRVRDLEAFSRMLRCWEPIYLPLAFSIIFGCYLRLSDLADHQFSVFGHKTNPNKSFH